MTSLVIFGGLFLSGIIVGLCTPIAADVGRRLEIVDQPSERKHHVGAIPRTGGVAIFLGIFVASVVVAVAVHIRAGIGRSDWELVLSMLAAASIVFLSGFLDDVKDLQITVRLVFQALASVIIFTWATELTAIRIPGFANPIDIPTWLGLVLTMLWLVGLTNAFNWIDGLDGLAGLTSAVTLGSLMMLAVAIGDDFSAVVAAIAVGACVSFVTANYPPAAIFMGDAGSYTLGFLAGAISLRLLALEVGAASSIAWLSLMLPVALPVVDMIRVIVVRLRDRSSPAVADRRHLHHKILERHNPRATLLIIASLNLALGLLGLLVWSLFQS